MLILKKDNILFIGQYKYFGLEKKRYRYITDKIEGVTGKKHYDYETIIKALKTVLENKITISDSSNYAKENYHSRSVPKILWV